VIGSAASNRTTPGTTEEKRRLSGFVRGKRNIEKGPRGEKSGLFKRMRDGQGALQDLFFKKRLRGKGKEQGLLFKNTDGEGSKNRSA